MNSENKKIYNDKERIVISGNDIDSIFTDDINFDDDNSYPISNAKTLADISKNMKSYNNLKRDKNTDILSISGDSIDTLDNSFDDITTIEEDYIKDKEDNNYKNNVIPEFSKSDIISSENTKKDNETDFNGLLTQLDLDNAIISYEENEDENLLLKDNFEKENLNIEDEKIKKLSLFFEDVLSKLSKSKREEILNSKNYNEYLSIINKK